MAASMKQIKTRIRSVESTRQITKAMELVASSKLRRAKQRVELARPYHEALLETISALQAGMSETSTVFSTPREVKRTCYVVIAGDRGLAGGYNANLFRMVRSMTEGIDYCVFPVGKKALEYYQHQGVELVNTEYGVTDALTLEDCADLGRLLCDGYAAEQFDRVIIAYTRFDSMLSQSPVEETLLPISLTEGEPCRYAGAILEGDAEALVARIVPQYVSGIVYATLCEASASEHGARRTAMNAANKNAGEIIDHLVLHYNRARQAVITQEITEIVSGAEAL